MLLHRHRAILWCAFGLARLNSRGVGLFEMPCFFLFLSIVSLQATTHSADNVQHCARAVELVVAGPCFVGAVLVWIFFGRPVAMKKRGELCNR